MMENKSTQRAELERSAKTEREILYRGKTIALRRDTMTLKDAAPVHWDIIEHPGAVVIIPIMPTGEILLIKQWRRAIQKIILELPAGTLEKDELPIVCAQRELQEETGFRADEIIPLGTFYSAPGFCTECLHLFAGLELELDPLPGDDDEAIDLVPVTLAQAKKMIASHEICDAKTIAGIYFYEASL